MTKKEYKKQPSDCSSIGEIRDEIDALDKEILKLLGERYGFVKEVVKYKEKTADSIVASKRREAVLAKRREWAVENGLNPDVIESIYRKLIEHFISEEMKIANIEPNK